MEDEGLTREHRETFAANLRDARASAAQPRFDPADLAAFLSRDHPSLNYDGSPANTASSGEFTITIKALPADRVDPFYPQGRMFADFLIETSGDRAIFGQIVRAKASGQDFAGWLHEHGASVGLPTTIAHLDVKWRAWLDRRLPMRQNRPR